MKNHMRNVYVAFAVMGVLSTNLAWSDEKMSATGKAGKEAAPSMDEMMKKTEAAATPGTRHKALDPLVGEWNVEARFWMPGSDQPMESKGTAKSYWILDGRFVQEEFNGEFMGKPFKGIGITGYDNIKEKYVSTWIDDMSTGVMFTEGPAKGKEFTLEGKVSCPPTGEKDKAVKTVIRIQSKDKHVVEMHDPTLGEKSKTGEIIYTRK